MPSIVDIFNEDAFKRTLDIDINRKREEVSEIVVNGSGWTVEGISTVLLDFARYEPIRGGSYFPLPSALKAKQALININNRDHACLRWAMKAAIYPVDIHPERTSKYPIDDGLDFTGISFPTPLHEIPKVEKLNNIAINVFGCKNKRVVTYSVSEMEGEEVPRINVMLVTKIDPHTFETINHYCLVKSLSRLLYEQHYRNHLVDFCVRCLQGFSTEALLEDHLVCCRGASNRPTRVEMPKKGENILRFKNYPKQMKAPYVIYADCESLIEKLDARIPHKEQSSTTKTEFHKPCGFSFNVVRSDGAAGRPFIYRGENPTRAFIDGLQKAEVLLSGIRNHCK